MSKRARDDASIASLKAILGDISDDIIENLLYRSNNNIETAVNLYFSEPQSAESRPESSLTKIRSVDQTCSEGIRYFIGEMVLTGTRILM
jgi:DNA repair protein RAD5